MRRSMGENGEKTGANPAFPVSLPTGVRLVDLTMIHPEGCEVNRGQRDFLITKVLDGTGVLKVEQTGPGCRWEMKKG